MWISELVCLIQKLRIYKFSPLDFIYKFPTLKTKNIPSGGVFLGGEIILKSWGISSVGGPEDNFNKLFKSLLMISLKKEDY